MRHNKLISGLLAFVAILLFSSFAILETYSENSHLNYVQDCEANLLKNIKTNYLNLSDSVTRIMDPLYDDSTKIDEVMAKFGDKLVYAALYDYDGNLIDNFGYSVPENLTASMFFENISFSDGYPQAEITMEDGHFYIQTGILTMDDTVFIATIDSFEEIVNIAKSIYDRDFYVYYGHEKDFAVLDGFPEIGKDKLSDLFTKTINSQRPESEIINVDGEESLVNVISVFDSSDWDVKAFFATTVPSSSWMAQASELSTFIWISGVLSVIFALVIIYFFFGRSRQDNVLSKGKSIGYTLLAFAPALLLTIIFGFSLFGSTLKDLSVETSIKASNGIFHDIKLLSDNELDKAYDGLIDRLSNTAGTKISINRGEKLLASDVNSKRLNSMEFLSIEKLNGFFGETFGEAKLNDVIHNYGTLNIGNISYTLLYEQTVRDNYRLSIQFFVVGMLCAISILGLVSGFIIANIRSTKLIMRTFIGYGFLLPALIHLVWWAVGPMAFSLFLAFRRWSIVDEAKPFVGLENFIELFHDLNFWNAMKNTGVYVLYVPIAMFISLLLAIAVNKLGKLSIVLRVVYYLPVVTAGVATTIVWRWIFNRDFGVLNFILGIFHIPEIAWLESPKTALISMMIMGIWAAIGSQMLIFLAGLQGIPKDFYDAASVDGANKPKIFWKITLPLLKPTSLFVLVTSIISSFQVFTPVYVLTQGGPLRATDVVFYHIWESAWVDMRMGYAATQSWILFLVLAVLTFVEFKLFGKDSWKAYY